ncbi:hypothetical protein BJV74DRAFT_830981 [Russula compacta]|nr:hypothetical protein BJV74DRAFT_830981 [Russula compacta]
MSLSQPSSSSLSSTLQDLKQIQIGKYVFLGAYTMLLYDHIITLPEEVHMVWKKKKTFPLYLFILVRYYTLLVVSVVAFGYFSTVITRSRCGHWMYFLPLGITIPLTLFPGMLMLIRVYALYNRNRIILYSLSTSLLLQTVAGLWQYTVSGAKPAPVPLDNYEYHFCIYLPPKRIGHLTTMYVSWELGYDTLVFLLTITRTVYMHWRHQGVTRTTGGLIGNLMRDGAFYFGCIFSMNLMWVLMILYAPTGLRAIASIPSSCVNTVMVCRITLNLRTTVYGHTTFERTNHTFPMSDLRDPRSGPSDQTLDPTATRNLRVHFRKDYDQAKDYNPPVEFPSCDVPGTRHQRAQDGQE